MKNHLVADRLKAAARITLLGFAMTVVLSGTACGHKSGGGSQLGGGPPRAAAPSFPPGAPSPGASVAVAKRSGAPTLPAFAENPPLHRPPATAPPSPRLPPPT